MSNYKIRIDIFGKIKSKITHIRCKEYLGQQYVTSKYKDSMSKYKIVQESVFKVFFYECIVFDKSSIT